MKIGERNFVLIDVNEGCADIVYKSQGIDVFTFDQVDTDLIKSKEIQDKLHKIEYEALDLTDHIRERPANKEELVSKLYDLVGRYADIFHDAVDNDK